MSATLWMGLLLICFMTTVSTLAQQEDFSVYGDIPEDKYPVYSHTKGKEHAYPIVTVDFSDHLREWDGFGVNYVEVSQTRDYSEWSQEYGGLSVLTEEERQRVIDLIFGKDGLRPGITKMFLDIHHEGHTEAGNDNNDPYDLNLEGYDHTTTTRWLRYFNRKGLQKTRSRGGDLKILTTMYGCPPWMTRQGYINGRDLDPAEKEEFAEYMVSWVKYLREEENLPVQYLSLHNEGDAYYRWPSDGESPGAEEEDYNLYWPPFQVVDMLKTTRDMLDTNGLENVGLTNGENQNWYRLHMWGYSKSIARDNEALENLSLITAHSFAFNDERTRHYGDWRSNGIDMLREAKENQTSMNEEDLHAWVMSMSWGSMDASFVEQIRRNIYMSKVNALTPWAIMQKSGAWRGGDPNPNKAFMVTTDSTLKVTQGYYFYKQVTRAGQPGMTVSSVTSLDPSVGVIAFDNNGTDNKDAFVIINIDNEEKPVEINLYGEDSGTYEAFRSSPNENYKSIGDYKTNQNGAFMYKAPAGSVTTFFAQ
jgi:hypothetical protein